MDKESQSLLADARNMLTEAKRENAGGKHGAALKCAYEASEYVAVAYLATVTNRMLPPNDTNFDLFAKTIREPNRHPGSLQEIKETVGDVCVLRETYEPALVDETSSQDARQMIEHVEVLLELATKITGKN